MSDNDLQLDDARIDALLRSMTERDLDLETPPAAIWTAIEADLARESGGLSTDTASPEISVVEESPLAPVVSLASRRRPAFIAAAVAAALVLIAGLAVVVSGDTGTDQIEVASAELVYIDDPAAFVPEGIGRSADARLLEDGEGELVSVDRADLPDAGADADLEIWLIGARADGSLDIQTLGTVDDPTGSATYAVPAEFDVDSYDAVFVDVSIEPHDGDEAHSGMSLVRGPLITA